MFKGQKIDGGKVHIFTNNSTFCTGRSMDFVVAVEARVDCAACVKRAAKNGMDAQAV